MRKYQLMRGVYLLFLLDLLLFGFFMRGYGEEDLLEGRERDLEILKRQ